MTTGRLARAEQPDQARAGKGRRAPAQMNDPRRRYMVVTMFAVLAAIAFLLAVMIIVAPGRVADAGLQTGGMIWGLLVLNVLAAAMVFTWFMFMVNRDGKEVRQ